MNYTPTAFKVLLLLKLFITHKTVSFTLFKVELTSLLLANTATTTEHSARKTAETLSISAFRKYVKTLRFLGCDIKTITTTSSNTKQQDATQTYQLVQHPLPWEANQGEWLLFLQLYSMAEAEEERPILAPLLWSLSGSLTNPDVTTYHHHASLSLIDQTIAPLPAFVKNALSQELQQFIQNIEAIQAAGDGMLIFLTQEKQPVSPLLMHSPSTVVPLNEAKRDISNQYQNTPVLCVFPKQFVLQQHLQLLLEDATTYQQHLIPLSLIQSIYPIAQAQLQGYPPKTVAKVRFNIMGKLVDSYEKKPNETILAVEQNPTTPEENVLLIEAEAVSVVSFFNGCKVTGNTLN
jgi:hypothetical protein